MSNWIFTVKTTEDKTNYYSIGYITNSVGNYSEVIRSADVVHTIKLVNILNGGNTTAEEITDILKDIVASPEAQEPQSPQE